MSRTMSEPLVTVLTPVYNGAEFLRECIESVLAQTYSHWEYLIVDNRSTDATPEIAQEYALRDPRIRHVRNDEFLSMPQNFNRAFRLVGPESSYTKVVCADDWLLPNALSKLVALGEAHPRVGIIAGHQQSGQDVRWSELPQSVNVLPGREACRLGLLKGVKLFGAPTGFLYRSTLMRQEKPFFPNDHPHSDTSACYEFLDQCDYGVVHDVLSVERLHSDQISSGIEPLAAGDLAYIETVLEYGPRYLSNEEYQTRVRQLFKGYYRFLGGALLKRRGQKFWDFQTKRLKDMGVNLSWPRIWVGAIAEAIAEARHPGTAFKKAVAAWRATA
jgi:glycosyltransferase involved in cell wall biosynthesis